MKWVLLFDSGLLELGSMLAAKAMVNRFSRSTFLLPLKCVPAGLSPQELLSYDDVMSTEADVQRLVQVFSGGVHTSSLSHITTQMFRDESNTM